MAVKIIKATKQAPGKTQGTQGAAERLKVAAYCRVSTDSEEQETSYEAQCSHYTDYIASTPGWVLAGIYADEGISGTSTKKREQFNRMLRDCEAGRIDMVVTKSISRWARNTIDSLKSIRRLKDLGIPVLFEKENINTMDARGEVLITIMSSLAQQESDSISRNVKMGKRFIMQQGKGELNDKQFCALSKGEDGKSLVIDNPAQADLVRRIYREYLEGYSPDKIAGHLTAEKIPTPARKETWYASTVASILENEKYCGDLLLQKYFVEDFLTHKVVRNTGQLPQYYVADHHEPIVPKQVFFQVQGEKQRRGMLKYDPSRFRFGNANALSGRLICGHCGRKLKRYTNPDPDRVEWRCRDRAYSKKSATKEGLAKCPCRNVPEKEAELAVVSAFNQLPTVRDALVRMQGGIWEGNLKRIDVMVENIGQQQARMEKRLDSLAADGIPGEEGVQPEEARFLSSEIGRLEEERTSLILERAELANTEVQLRMLLELVDAMKAKRDGAAAKPKAKGLPPACYDYGEFFERTRYVPEDGVLAEDGSLVGFDNDLALRYIDTVTVTDEGYEVNFKAGIAVTIELTKA